jgi:acetolactate synthase-1/2/3 large subunit
MHLNDAFGENPSIDCRYLHHEQAAAMAAEGYARIAGKPAILNVTTGPGALNAFNGIFGAYTDSIPMLVLAGQVRLDTISNIESETGIRQLGDQEVRSMNMVKEITKARFLVKYPEEIVQVIDAAYFEAVTGRPGPIWVEIPVNIQGSLVDADPTAKVIPPKSDQTEIQPEVLESVIERLSKASRPVIISGSGVRLSGTENQVLELAERLEVPITTAWTHDTINSDHKLYAGRPGTIGTRPGNFVVQNAVFQGASWCTNDSNFKLQKRSLCTCNKYLF